MSPNVVDAVTVGGRGAPSRVMFGPHETNLARGRAISDGHAAYYRRRAAGGAGVIVTETASVTANDWPYERAPLAAACPPGWEAVAEACAPWSTLVLAGLGHSGSQGSSAYSQEVMWAPSPVADVVTREPPAALDEDGIHQIVAAFGDAAVLARGSGLAGVEIDAGAWSLLRQFLSGLTNQRSDRFGQDRLLMIRLVLEEVRRRVGPDFVVALRLSCDELAPWAGITPEQAAPTVAAITGWGLVDMLTVIKAGPFSTGAYRPDAHIPESFNWDLCRAMRAVAGDVPVVLQGSVVDPGRASAALGAGVCDLVEMTRALIADARLVEKLRNGRPDAVRPCLLCNQACRVRDPRNPIVSCVVDPASGHEADEPALAVAADSTPADPPVHPGAAGASGLEASSGPPVLVVGAGPAGLECATVLARGGRQVRVVERGQEPGGALRRAAVGPGRSRLGSICEWLAAEAHRLGLVIDTGVEVDAGMLTRARRDGWQVVLATGARPVADRYPTAALPVLDPLAVLGDPGALPEGPVAVIDPVGDAVAVNLAEWLATDHGRKVTLICPDPVAGTQLSRTGDLADANGRLQRAGVQRRLRSLVRSIGPESVHIEDCWTAEASEVAAAAVIDCGHRLPDEALYQAVGDPGIARAGDCVAPRSALEAVLEGRRVALRLLGWATAPARARAAVPPTTSAATSWADRDSPTGSPGPATAPVGAGPGPMLGSTRR
ncbi:MAG: mycofactocin system FadH/OYE family oxidoreductase 1 [Acidobacteriota bacterium]|nr:mycofactocin system FadH/OYE family oxidoreductase 1 [Acidobacteriota bacterium]